MANSLFNNYANLMLGSGTHTLADLSSDDIEVHLIDAADHTTNLSSDIDEADVTDSAIVATADLGTLSVSAGVFDAADTTFSSVTGDESEELILWFNSGTDTTSPLIANFDTFSSGMPVTPNGGDITVSWNASGIISLV